MTSSVVFIDSRVADPDSLIASLAPGTACYRLDAASDGLAQIAAVLSQHTGLDSVRIVSHGAPGSLLLGAGTLDAAGLAARSATLADIGASLGPDGDLLLYGCSVADGTDGRNFIDLLAQLTGADVAASTDPTGAAGRGGDWDLEAHTGTIEAARWQAPGYAGILASGNSTGTVSISGTVTQNQVLTASNTLADPDILGAVTYQWQSSSDNVTWSNASTGTTLTLTEPLVGKYIRVIAKYTDGSGSAEAINSTATAVVANVNDAATGSVTISGTAAQGQTLAATNTIADADGLGTISYQWQSFDGLIWSPIVGSTTAVLGLTQNEVGKTVRVIASYTDGRGTTESVTSAASATIANTNDTPTGTVNITGTVTITNTLTASLSAGFDDPDGLGIVSFQWQSSSNGTTWTNLSTGNTLGLSAAQTGKYIRVVATYTDSGGTAETVASSATSAVTGINTAPSGSVGISGTTTQGQVLTASHTLADPDGLGSITYQWQSSNDAGATWNNISTGATLTLAEAQVGQLVRVTANYVDGGSTSESVASSATAAIVNINDALSGSVVVTGTATQGQTLTAGNTLADADGLGAITYQWQASSNGTVWNNLTTGNTLTLAEAQVGQYIRVNASYTDGHGTAETANSAATAIVANINDALSGGVAIAGTVTQGQTLTASNTLADADGLGTVAYQWQVSNDGTAWSNLSTGATLTLAEAQVGKYIRASASYTDGHGTVETANSAATATVGNINDAYTGTVTVSGSAMVNQTLTASNTLADPDGLGTVAYQWQHSTDGGTTWSNVAGGTGSSLTIGVGLLNDLIRVRASYTDGHGTAESATSTSTTVVLPPNTAPTGSVVITGTVAQNQTLKATNTLADADGLGVITYQWQTSTDGTTWANHSTGSSLALAEAQVGKYIRVLANYTDGLTVAESVASSATAAVANVNDALTGSATISGTVSLNQVLTASNTFADADGLGTIAYQWQSSSDGTTWTNISTGATLGLSEAQVGKKIRVVGSYTDGHGTLESSASTATIAVTNINTSPTGSVTVSGTVTQGQTLTASNTLADADGLGTVTYQWQGSADNGTTWSNIATGNTLVLAEAQVGKRVRVLANYVDGMFTSESIASTATTAVANTNDAPAGSVSISGTAALNRTLTASHSLTDNDGLGSIYYVWQSSSDKGASWSTVSVGETLSLTEALVGKQIRVTANYTDGHGTAESVASGATTEVRGSGSSTGGDDDGGHGSGNDKITGESGDNVIDAGGGNNTVTTGAGNDQITAGSGNDKIKAGDGDNIINAGNGKNSIVTGAGNDQIVTGSGSDKIEAGAGNDTVNPGAGKDKVTLGLGADVLILDSRASGGADTVNYFNATEDQFLFDTNAFAALAGGIGADNLVIGTRPVARDADDFLLFDTQKGRLYYDADGDGSGKAILIVAVKFAIGTPDIDNFAVF